MIESCVNAQEFLRGLQQLVIMTTWRKRNSLAHDCSLCSLANAKVDKIMLALRQVCACTTHDDLASSFRSPFRPFSVVL